MKGIEGKLYIKDETPIFFKARSVPYAMKERVELEIERQKEGESYYRSSEFRVGDPDSTDYEKRRVNQNLW